MQWTTIETVTVVALFAGPLLAILVARHLEQRRAKRERRMDVFRTLMRTRASRLSSDHVAALNLVEIEFQDKEEVIDAWNKYFEHLSSQHPRKADEEILPSTSKEEIQVREERYNKRLADSRNVLVTKLLHEIAKTLKYKLESLEILGGGYAPQGWAEIEFQQGLIRQYGVDLYYGRRALPVAVVDYTSKE